MGLTNRQKEKRREAQQAENRAKKERRKRTAPLPEAKSRGPLVYDLAEQKQTRRAKEKTNFDRAKRIQENLQKLKEERAKAEHK